MRQILVLFVVICVCNATPTSPLRPSVRAGRCPPTPKIALTCNNDFNPEVNCETDEACPNPQKCCTQGCLTKFCVNPVVVDEVPPPPVEPKIGNCPTDAVIGVCSVPNFACTSDQSCPGSTKCCSEGCNKVCLDPVFPPKI